MGKTTLNITRMSLRMLIYSILFGIFLSLGWIDPHGSILHNIGGGFFLWVLPQIAVYFFLRGRDFGFSKRWLIRGVVYAILLTVFLNQSWITQEGEFINNIMFGMILFTASYLISFMFE